MDIKTADDALKMYRWAAGKWHAELDASASISSTRTQPSEWRKRRRQEESSSAAFKSALKFSGLKDRYWSMYQRLGGKLPRDAVDQAVCHSRRIQRASQ